MNDYLDLEIWLSSGAIGGRAAIAAEEEGSAVPAGLGEAPIVAVVRLSDPVSVDEDEPFFGITTLDTFARQPLDPLADAQAYGRGLTRALFASPTVQGVYSRALTAADKADPKRLVRFRLRIHPSVQWLHRLHWETLVCPKTLDDVEPIWIGARPRVMFSRTIAAQGDWSFQQRAKERLRALVVVANPPDLRPRELEGELGGNPREIDVAGELRRAEEALGPLIESKLTSLGQPVTFEALSARLREGYDILYLVCHGNVSIAANGDQNTILLFQDANGDFGLVEGGRLVEELASLARRPLLVILAVCHSVGSFDPSCPGKPEAPARSRDDGGALAGLGPRLIAQAGVGAVLAMQGSVLMSTVVQFMPVFLKHLIDHGRVDLAMTAARGAIVNAPDRWMPVLFTRLRTGAIWYQPGVQGINDADWVRTIDRHLRRDICLPIIGPGVAQNILGSAPEFTRVLAASLDVKLQPGVDVELPRVAQTIVARTDLLNFRMQYVTTQTDILLRRSRDNLKQEQREATDAWGVINDRARYDRLVRARRLFELCAVPPDRLAAFLQVPEEQVARTLGELFEGDEWDRADWETCFRILDLLTFAIGFSLDPNDPHRILVRRNLSLYLTSRSDSLLHGAMAAERITPRVETFRWSLANHDWLPSIFEDPEEYKYEPSARRPLIYHLFGRFDRPKTLVLTEDDYFEYLMRMGSIPSRVNAPDWSLGLVAVRAGLTERALLFLGFQVDDWAFRVVLRSLLDGERRSSRAARKANNELPISIGVQLEPNEQMLLPRDMRTFFTRFYERADVGVFWGEPGDFLRAIETLRIREPGI